MIRKNNDADNQDFDSDIDLDDADLAYELDDSEEALDDEALIDEQEWQEDEKKSSKRKQKSSRGGGSGLGFNTMVIIGAVVVGAGVLVFNVMNQSSKQSENQGAGFQSSLSVASVIDGSTAEVPSPDDQQAVVDPNAAVPADATQDNGADAGLLNGGMEGLPDESAGQNPPQPSPIMPADTTADVVTPLPEQGSDVVIDTTQTEVVPGVAQPDSNGGAAEDLLKQAMQDHAPADDTSGHVPAGPDGMVVAESQPVMPDQEPVVAAPAIQDVPVASPVSTGQESAQVARLEEKLNDVLSRMDRIESDIAAVKSSKDSGADVEKLEKSVKSLKDEIKTLKSDQSARSAETPSFAEAAPVEKKAEAKPVAKAKATPKRAVPETAYNIPGAQPARPAPVAAAPAASPVAQWELRAAQPGRAWVSRPGDRDMQSVEVGQTLPGIGKVIGIVYQDGRWTVQGANGQIRQ
jgi:hypothetical protein